MRAQQTLPFIGLSILSMPVDNAGACACEGFEEIVDSAPEDGASDVPTDVAPWVYGDPSAVLVDAVGDLVPVRDETLERYPGDCWGARELVPVEPLKPNSRYFLVSSPSLDNFDAGTTAGVTFTTGDGPLTSSPPKMPQVDMIAFYEEEVAGCFNAGPRVCIDTGRVELIDVRLTTDGQGSDARFVGKNPRGAPFGLFESGETCVSVRARDSAGRLSEPWTQCVELDGLPRSSQRAPCGEKFASALSPIDAAAPEGRPGALPGDAGVEDDGGSKRQSNSGATKGPHVSSSDTAGGCAIRGNRPKSGFELGLITLGSLLLLLRRRPTRYEK